MFARFRAPNGPHSHAAGLAMPKVTALIELPENKKRRRVVFDDGTTVELSLEAALAAGLLPNRTVSGADVRNAAREDRRKAAEKDALRLLKIRNRSEAELRKELAKRGHGDEAVEEIIKKCRGWRYLDDQRFAEQLVNEAIAQKKLGPARIKHALRARGVDDALAESALSKADAEHPSLVEQALLALRPKLRSYNRLEPQVAHRRMVAFLQRRGFDFATIREAMKRAGQNGEDLSA